jgi:hypothetical protein
MQMAAWGQGGVYSGAPAEARGACLQPGLTMVVEGADYLTPEETAGWGTKPDRRMVKLRLLITDTSGAERFLPQYSQGALFAADGSKVGYLTGSGGGGFEYSEAPGAWTKMHCSVTADVPAQPPSGVWLYLPIARYRVIRQEFAWGEVGKALKLPVEGSKGGFLVRVDSAELGEFRTEAQRNALRAAGEKVEDEKPHLILKVYGRALGPDAFTAEPEIWNMQITTVEGQQAAGPHSIGVSGFSQPGAPGVRVYEGTMACHFPEVTALPQISRVSFTAIRKVNVDENWVPLPENMLQAK